MHEVCVRLLHAKVALYVELQQQNHIGNCDIEHSPMLHLIEAFAQKLGKFLRCIQLHIATVAGNE